MKAEFCKVCGTKLVVWGRTNAAEWLICPQCRQRAEDQRRLENAVRRAVRDELAIQATPTRLGETVTSARSGSKRERLNQLAAKIRREVERAKTVKAIVASGGRLPHERTAPLRARSVTFNRTGLVQALGTELMKEHLRRKRRRGAWA